ncbi:MAG TPA: tyrosine-protein phosphatase [Pirellulales bacterium]|nr:tyrosine-protein phosphatase [Pirellulales bacterium]
MLALAVAAAYAGWWAFWHHHAKRFQEVRKGVFYRVAQPSELGFRYLVNDVGVKTVLSVQLYDFRLRRGLVSFGPTDGCRESEYVEQLGARPVQWPMGVEKSWPWLTPWQFEQFFRLMDDPDNWPVAVHCQGGRHRTGTLSALFRLEYDRWPADRALAEMYSFKFGGAIRLQEHNLRTYLPRPHPDAAEWNSLASFCSALVAGPCADYEELVRRLRALREALRSKAAQHADAGWDQRACERRTTDSHVHDGGPALASSLVPPYEAGSLPEVDEQLSNYIQHDGHFAIPLTQRLIDQPDDPLVPVVAAKAAASVESLDAGRANWSMAAALLADFGGQDQQRRLRAALSDAAFQQASPERFDALVDGVTNRYTPNRIAFLVPLLENEAGHLRDGARQYRYCDTAVARLSAIVDENFPDIVPGWGIDAWNNGRVAARAWLASHPAETELRPLVPASGQTEVLPGDPAPREDLSRAKL